MSESQSREHKRMSYAVESERKPYTRKVNLHLWTSHMKAPWSRMCAKALPTQRKHAFLSPPNKQAMVSKMFCLRGPGYQYWFSIPTLLLKMCCEHAPPTDNWIILHCHMLLIPCIEIILYPEHESSGRPLATTSHYEGGCGRDLVKLFPGHSWIHFLEDAEGKSCKKGKNNMKAEVSEGV